MARKQLNTMSTLAMIAAVLGLSACTTTPDAAPIAVEGAVSDDALINIIADYNELASAVYGVSDPAAEDYSAWAHLPDVTPDARRSQLDGLEGLAARLEALPTVDRDMSPDHVNRIVLSRVVADKIERLRFDEDRIPFDNSYGFHTTALRGLYDDTRTPAERLARLNAIPAYLDANIANMQRGLETGMVASGQTVDLIIFALKVQRVELLAETSDWQMDDGAVDQTIAALDRTIAFLERDYRPNVPDLRAARDQTDGATWYESLVRHHTGSALSPDDIHELGRSEVARIRRRMEDEIAASGFDGDFSAYQAHLRTDPQYYAANAEDLMEKAALLAKRIDDEMPSLFATLPRLTYGVRPVPDEIAPRYTTGRYWTGSPEDGKAGGYMVNTYALDQRPLYELPALTLHEAVPGHHHQIALSQELDDLPEFRRRFQPTAFVEGWALYAESLGEEIDFYRTPAERFGRLSYEMWRACRLVADTGIHWKGWSVDEARACFDDNTALSPLNITTELERYVAWPGQALAYKVGELEFKRLREKAEAGLGDSFDRRHFHDVLLTPGALPFDLVEANVDAWMAAVENAEGLTDAPHREGG